MCFKTLFCILLQLGVLEYETDRHTVAVLVCIDCGVGDEGTELVAISRSKDVHVIQTLFWRCYL